MAFMRREIYRGSYYEVAANGGERHIVPVDVSGLVATYGDLKDYIEGNVDNPEGTAVRLAGWVCRLSAPGYMDCTPWSACDSQAACAELLTDMYGNDDDEDED
jgi:hypothetical protein